MSNKGKNHVPNIINERTLLDLLKRSGFCKCTCSTQKISTCSNEVNSDLRWALCFRYGTPIDKKGTVSWGRRFVLFEVCR